MSIRRIVLDTVQRSPGAELTSEDVFELLEREYPAEGITRNQISNSLADLAAWSEIARVRRGVYMAKRSKPEEPTEQEEFPSAADIAYAEKRKPDAVPMFRQIGTLLDNAGLIIRSESNGALYEAFPMK